MTFGGMSKVSDLPPYIPLPACRSPSCNFRDTHLHATYTGRLARSVCRPDLSGQRRYALYTSALQSTVSFHILPFFQSQVNFTQLAYSSPQAGQEQRHSHLGVESLSIHHD